AIGEYAHKDRLAKGVARRAGIPASACEGAADAHRQFSDEDVDLLDHRLEAFPGCKRESKPNRSWRGLAVITSQGGSLRQLGQIIRSRPIAEITSSEATMPSRNTRSSRPAGFYALSYWPALDSIAIVHPASGRKYWSGSASQHRS